MRRILLLLVCLLLACVSVHSAVCNATHFALSSRYTLGKQDELNRTFSKMQEKITVLPDTLYNPTPNTTYTITNITPHFHYLDSKQKAVIRGNDTIFIEGGELEVSFTFNWTRRDTATRVGWATAQGNSFQIIIAKKLIIDEGFYSYELLSAMPVDWDDTSGFSLTRIDPPNSTDLDLAALRQMLNNLPSGKDVRSLLKAEMDKSYEYFLKASLHDEHQPIDSHFDYTWNKLTIPFYRRPISVDLEKIGILLTFDAQIENYPGWTCGTRLVPPIPLDDTIFGGIQEFISFDFYESVLKWAVANKLLDSDLSPPNWSNRMFSFHAGDLYETFALLQQKYYASQPVSGLCSAAPALRMDKNSTTAFNLYLQYDCQLQIDQDLITKFTVDLRVVVTGIARTQTIDFRVVDFEAKSSFIQVQGYRLTNQALAEAMLKDSLSRIKEGEVFGSGWPQSPPRDYPHMIVQTNYTIVYDSTHVGSTSR